MGTARLCDPSAIAQNAWRTRLCALTAFSYMKIQIKELHMLQPHVWLNDEVLNCCGGLIMRRSEQHFDFLKGSTAWGFRS
jgi:hypothetical protein